MKRRSSLLELRPCCPCARPFLTSIKKTKMVG